MSLENMNTQDTVDIVLSVVGCSANVREAVRESEDMMAKLTLELKPVRISSVSSCLAVRTSNDVMNHSITAVFTVEKRPKAAA